MSITNLPINTKHYKNAILAQNAFLNVLQLYTTAQCDKFFTSVVRWCCNVLVKWCNGPAKVQSVSEKYSGALYLLTNFFQPQVPLIIIIIRTGHFSLFYAKCPVPCCVQLIIVIIIIISICHHHQHQYHHPRRHHCHHHHHHHQGHIIIILIITSRRSVQFRAECH